MVTMLKEQDILKAAESLRCEPAAIRAVYKVEANGSGFLDDGKVKGELDSEDRVKILFEGHKFWKQLAINGYDPKKFLEVHPQYSDVLYEKWTKVYYVGGSGEWARLSKAIEVCKLLNESK
jgi:hypothetical protein